VAVVPLKRAGCQVELRADGQSAVQAAPTCYDIVFTDFNMPGLSGLAVAEQVRLAAPESLPGATERLKANHSP
jgi:CheY-like chemotaxis protein